MAITVAWLLPISLLIVFELVADVLAKEWQLRSGPWWAAGALLAYVVANSFWLFALRNGATLAQGGMIFSVACAVLALVVGWWWYGESLSNVQLVGCGLGLVSLVLVLWE